MARMPVMDAAIKVLEDEGVEVIFGIPGANINGFYASLAKSNKIRHYISRHEEGAIYSADGYARATGKVGVCAATSGPGASNFVTGLYGAQADSIPLVAITGQHVRAMQGREGFQALDITEVARPVVKKAFYVRDVAHVPWVFREAFRIAREGRPGPVLIDLPLDVQRGDVEYDPELESPLAVHKPQPSPAKIKRALEMVLAAEKPILMIGGKLVSQSLSGGGWVGTEYPLMAKVRYRDAAGSELTWARGFYVTNDEKRPVSSGVLVPPAIWLPVAVDLFDPAKVAPRPAQILWVEVEASGWEYESLVTNVRLEAD